MLMHLGRSPTYLLLRVRFGLDCKAEKAEASTVRGNRRVAEYMEEFAEKNWRGPVGLRDGKPVRSTRLIPFSLVRVRR